MRLVDMVLGVVYRGVWRRMLGVACGACLICASINAAAGAPDWLFPTGPAPAAPAPHESSELVHLPTSQRSYTRGELADLFSVPDWHPESHSRMPDIVSHGRKPDVFACGYCHTASGQGRPENASIAGLPADYIAEQLRAFASGTRRSAGSDDYAPTRLMARMAQDLTAEESADAARYFAQQLLQPRVQVLERTRVPRPHASVFVYVADPAGGDEPLGERLLEFAPDPIRHEARDDTQTYITYVPPGSRKRGRAIASGLSRANGCVVCHGLELRGIDQIPRLAGRSPSYLLRQLFAFKTGARGGDSAGPMRKLTTTMNDRDMIDVIAYAGSLPP